MKKCKKETVSYTHLDVYKRQVMKGVVSEVKVTLILTIEVTEILETEATEMVAEIEVSDNIH